jgi:uncharacterized lipoprotein YddW (UPF0748 family)
MNPAIITALVRHLLTAISGAAAVRYSVDGVTFDAIVSGLAAAAGVAWSVVDKRRRAGVL